MNNCKPCTAKFGTKILKVKGDDLTTSSVCFLFFFILMQSADGDAQTLTEVDLFISTQRIKVLNADSQVRTSKHTYIMFLFFTRERYSHQWEWKLFTLPVPQPPTEVLHIRGVLLCHSWRNCSLTVDTLLVMKCHDWLWFCYFFI